MFIYQDVLLIELASKSLFRCSPIGILPVHFASLDRAQYAQSTAIPVNSLAPDEGRKQAKHRN